MTTSLPAPRGAVSAGALYGAAAWLIYAAVEYGFAALGLDFTRAHCGTALYGGLFPLELLLGYPIVGAGAGAAAALVSGALARSSARAGRSQPGSSWLPLVGALTLAWLVAVPAAMEAGRNLRGILLWGIVSSATAVFLAHLFGRRAPVPILRVFVNPWVLALAVQGLLWLRVRHALFGDPVQARYQMVFGYVGAIYGIGILVVLLSTWRRRAFVVAPAGPRVLLPGYLAFAGIFAARALLDPGTFASAAAPAMAQGKRPPNIILLVMDTVRADHVSLYGYDRETTPNLREFARGATMYSRAFAASDYTLPSLGAMFTGRFPTSHGAHTEDPRLHADRAIGDMAMAGRMITLPEILSDAGYATAAVVANYGFLSPRYGLDQGFDTYAVPFPGCAPSSASFGIRRVLASVVPAITVPDRDAVFSNAALVNDEIAQILRRVGAAARPFFLFVDYMDAHWPYAPPAPYDRRFPGRDPSFDEDSYVKLKRSVMKREQVLPAKTRAHLISQYDGGIAFLDHQIGALLDDLKARGLYDDSLIVVTADHGESFGDRQLMEHNVSVYQEQIAVPLIVKYPGQTAGRVVSTPVSGADFTPTVLELLRLPVLGGTQGRSLMDETSADRQIVSESFPRPALLDLDPRFHRVQRAKIEWPYKLIVSTDGTRELYRLDTDPGERQNLFAPTEPAAASIAARLDAWLAQAVAEVGEAPTMDPESLERLRSLGYVR
jgi:arylsulfatase A-like enzyme